MQFGGHIGFFAVVLDLRQNLRWPRSVLQIMWSEVHESTEKNVDWKKAVLPGLDLSMVSALEAFLKRYAL